MSGNLLLDRLLGAHLYWSGDETPPQFAPRVMRELEAMGRKPYLVPYGGSNVLGATSYVAAMGELMRQLSAENLNIDFIIFASSSGGTTSRFGSRRTRLRFRGKLLGISVDRPAGDLKSQAARAYRHIDPSWPPACSTPRSL